MKERPFEDIGIVDARLTCIICHEVFTDIWDHLLEHKKHDPDHIAYMKEIDKHEADELGVFKLPCFCGGVIRMNGTGQDSWETTCQTCDFLWDED